METLIFVVIVGLIGGIAVGIQGPSASLMTQRLGMLESVFILHLGGTLVAAIPLLVMGGGQLSNWRTVPWYALLCGTLGLVVVASVSYSIPRIGVTTTIMLFVTGQLVIGAILDHFGLLGATIRPFDWQRLLGIAILALGTWLMVRH